MTVVATGPLIERAIDRIDARRAYTGPIDTEYVAKVQTPDGRFWSLRLSPGEES